MILIRLTTLNLVPTSGNYPDSAAGERAGRPLAASSARMHHHHHWHSSPSRLPTAAERRKCSKKMGGFERKNITVLEGPKGQIAEIGGLTCLQKFITTDFRFIFEAFPKS
jgi:hypothetical protein